MSNYDTQNINVLNYNENEVFVDSNKEHYKFGASKDGSTPTIISMPLSELQYIATNTNAITTGWLTFDNDVKKDIFKDLRIVDWMDILTNEDITNILTHPTLEGLRKLLNITSLAYFDRVRIIMFKLMRDDVDITTKVRRIVEQRYSELRNKQRNTSIVLTQKDTQKYATPEDVKELSAQNALLQSQLEEVRKMMEQMVAAQNSSKQDLDKTTKPDIETKKSGRLKKEL